MLFLKSFYLKKLKTFYYKDIMYIYMLGVLLFMAYGRWDSILNNFPLDPDEGMLGAGALRIMENGLNFNAVDNTTSGILNSLMLLWPRFFGLSITLFTGRLTALFILYIVFVFTYLSIKLFSNHFFAFLFSLPLVLFYSLASNSSFLHYSTELSPLMLVVCSNYLSLCILKDKKKLKPLSIWKIILIGLFIGSVPFTKLQAVPIAAVIGIFTLWLLCFSSFKNKINVILIYIISCISPLFFFLTPLVVKKTWYHIYNYIVYILLYINDYLSLIDFLHEIYCDELLFLLIRSLSLFCLMFLVLQSAYQVNTNFRFLAIYLFILCCAAIFSVFRSGRAYSHYIMLLLPFLSIYTGYLAGIIDIFTKRKKFLLKLSLCIFLFLNYSVLFYSNFNFKRSGYSIYNLNSWNFQNQDIFTFLSPKSKGAISIWGWMAHWYIWSGLASATRESMTENEIKVWSNNIDLQNYYRKRFIQEIYVSKPDFIIDAVVGRSFGYNQENIYGLNSFPELHTIVEQDFTVLREKDKFNADCAKIYVRKEKLLDLKKQLIDFKSIVASAELSELRTVAHIDDYSVTEDTCDDYWVLPSGTLGFIDIKFNELENVKELLVLNVANKMHATDEISVTFFNQDREVYLMEKIKINNHPVWTKVLLKEPIYADHVKINIISFKGDSGGLNEVKLRKSPLL